MAGPYFMAKPLIEKHDVAVFSSNYNLYGDLSWRVMETLRMILGKKNVEVYSVDEAFVDLSMFPPEDLQAVAKEIRTTVEDWTGIKVSVGVAPTKVLAKLANRIAKKDKQLTDCITVLETEEKISAALHKTPVSDIWGVGGQYAKKVKRSDILSLPKTVGFLKSSANPNDYVYYPVWNLRGGSVEIMKIPVEEKEKLKIGFSKK